MDPNLLPTQRLTRQEIDKVRELIADFGEQGAARQLRISVPTLGRSLSGLTLEALTVQKIRGRMAEGAR